MLADLGADGAFVDNDYADDHHLSIGSTVKQTFPSGVTESFRRERHLRPADGRLAVRPDHDLGGHLGQAQPPAAEPLLVRDHAAAARRTRTRPRSTRQLASFPNAKVQTRDEFVDNQISGLSSVLNILYVLLALSVVVSLFGIVNTLVLTVFERTREIGMLRAVGMTRRQVRRMIRHESVITAMIGGVLGILLGIALGALLVARVDFIDFTLPVGQLIVFAIAAIVVGVLAAIFPARRAARLNVLRALQYE